LGQFFVGAVIVEVSAEDEAVVIGGVRVVD
jgi:hypothetical protein